LRLLASYDAGSGTLRLVRTDGAPGPGRDLQLWALLGDGTPRALGVLSDARSSSLTIAQELRGELPRAPLALSDEPDGGSTSDQPSGPVLALGGLSDPEG
jgi:anti-sigma-K factor RskA